MAEQTKADKWAVFSVQIGSDGLAEEDSFMVEKTNDRTRRLNPTELVNKMIQERADLGEAIYEPLTKQIFLDLKVYREVAPIKPVMTWPSERLQVPDAQLIAKVEADSSGSITSVRFIYSSATTNLRSLRAYIKKNLKVFSHQDAKSEAIVVFYLATGVKNGRLTGYTINSPYIK